MELLCSRTAVDCIQANHICPDCLCSSICPNIDLPVSPMYTLPHLQGILQTTSSCFLGLTLFLGCTRCDLSVVLDLKRLVCPAVVDNSKESDCPLTYGSTAVDLITSLCTIATFHDIIHFDKGLLSNLFMVVI